MATSDVLNFTEIPTVDHGIERFEFHEYEPVARTNLNSAEEIRINIEQQDLFTLPSEAYLLLEGRLLKLDGTAYVNADVVSLTNNGIKHLFSQISYQLSNQEIESVYYPGQATTMLGMLKYPNNFQLAQGLYQLWYKDSSTITVNNTGFTLRQAYIIQKPTTKGTFSFCIPLRHIFGFCDDYNKVIYRFKHTLTLDRKGDTKAFFRNALAAAGKVNLDKISLFIPHVIPSDLERVNLYKSIESNVTLPVTFRARLCDTITASQSTTFSWRLSVKTSPEKPRYIIVGFQTNKDGNQEVNSSIFDHCDLKNMYIMLNQEKYPAVDYSLLFPNHQFSRSYRDASIFSEKYYGMNDLITQSNITLSDNKDLYPLIVFDVGRQSEKLESSVVDVQIKATFNAAVAADTEAFAVVISDKFSHFQSDGNKLNVVY
ncbi:uncharacterized protein LOC136088253 [Hydra vulgaris]|uniref:Uncharacterized protein LOC136088253 n=1 Tax=Hydra vulgaris TaxID=6087 RepID=A0ABM4D178_HYDVU